MKWRSLIPVSPFHTELIASVVVVVVVVVVVAIVIFSIYLFVGSFDDPKRGGELSFQKLDAIESRNFVMCSCCSCWISGKGF